MDASDAYYATKRMVDAAKATLASNGRALMYVRGIAAPLDIKDVDHERYVVIAGTVDKRTFYVPHADLVAIVIGPGIH